jgi:hypothetical protein
LAKIISQLFLQTPSQWTFRRSYPRK